MGLLFAALLLMANPSATSAEQMHTCPGGPIFGFLPQSAQFDAFTEKNLSSYIALLNSPIWRYGWLNVSPTILDLSNPAALALARKRQKTIRQRLVHLGIAAERIRFDPPNTLFSDERATFANAYPSTTSVPEKIWDRIVSPGFEC